MRGTFEVAIVGAGPAGLFAALELARSGRKSVCLIDSGPGLEERLAHPKSGTGRNPWAGFGGAGFFLGGRLALDSDSPSSIPSNVPNARARELQDELIATLSEWEANGTLLQNPPEALVGWASRAIHAGLMMPLNFPARHLTQSERMRALKCLRDTLVTCQVGIKVGTTLVGLSPSGAGWRLEVEAADHSMGTLEAESVLLAPGRAGASWLAQLMIGLGAVVRDRTSVGVRIEVESSVWEPITNLTPDPRFMQTVPSGQFRTYACARGAYIVSAGEGKEQRITLRPGGEHPSPNTSFSVLWAPDEAFPQDPQPPTWSRLKWLLPNLSISPVPITQPTGEFEELDRRPGWPAEFWSGFEEFMLKIELLLPGTANPETIAYSPAIERYWDYDTGPDGASDIPGIWLAGDGAGLSQGAMAAAVSGMVAGRAIAALNR